MSERQNFHANNNVNSHARKLWFAAKRNFYYRDDPFRAALLCRQILAQSAWCEEADEAKLLLHDIGIDLRKPAVGGCRRRTVHLNVSPTCGPRIPEDTPGAGMKVALTTAIVVLPIIGIARDGIVGIAVPEAAAVIMLGSLFWVLSRIRNFVKGSYLPQRCQKALR